MEGDWLPSGTVEFHEGDQVIGRSRVALGTVPRSASVGVHTYRARFVPSDPGAVADDTSAPVTVVVRQ